MRLKSFSVKGFRSYGATEQTLKLPTNIANTCFAFLIESSLFLLSEWNLYNRWPDMNRKFRFWSRKS